MVNRRKREYLTKEEIDKLLAAAKTTSRSPARDYCLLLLRFRHGLRVSEACILKLSDIDLESKVFHVRRLKGCDHGVHDFYNGESVAIRDWLVERERMNLPAETPGAFHQRTTPNTIKPTITFPITAGFRDQTQLTIGEVTFDIESCRVIRDGS